MKMQSNKLRWITVIILALCLVLFFLPYVSVRGSSYNPIGYLELIDDNRLGSAAQFEVYFGFIAPVVLTALSMLIMLFKVSTAKCIICVILNILAVIIYLIFFSKNIIMAPTDSTGIGLIGNVIASSFGIVLPIIVLIRKKSESKHTRATI